MAKQPILIGNTTYDETTTVINLSDPITQENEIGTNSLNDSTLVPDKNASSDIMEYEVNRYDKLLDVIMLCSNSLNQLLLDNLDLTNLTFSKYTRYDSLSKSYNTLQNVVNNTIPPNTAELKLKLFKCLLENNLDKSKCTNFILPLEIKRFENLTLPNLEYFSLNSTIVDLDFIYYILLAKINNTVRQLQQLDYLDLSSTNLILVSPNQPGDSIIPTTSITYNQLYNVFNKIAPNLKILKISNTNFTDPKLLYNMINGADELIQLFFKQNSKPNIELDFTTPFKQLKVLDFSNITSKSIDSNNNFTINFTISQNTLHKILINSPILEELYLSGNDLKDFRTDIQPKLIELNRLKILRLDNTNINTDYLNYILEYTPYLQVLGLNSEKLLWDIDDSAVLITKLQLSELYLNIFDLDLQTNDRDIIDKIIKPIDTLKTLELPYIESFDYGYLAFRSYRKVVLYNNKRIAQILSPTNTDPPARKKANLETTSEDIKDQLNNIYNENMGITTTSPSSPGSSNTVLMVVIIFIILIITGVGGFLLFKYL